jgi:hypothetical protein
MSGPEASPPVPGDLRLPNAPLRELEAPEQAPPGGGNEFSDPAYENTVGLNLL